MNEVLHRNCVQFRGGSWKQEPGNQLAAKVGRIAVAACNYLLET